jgi:hypothetical protein
LLLASAGPRADDWRMDDATGSGESLTAEDGIEIISKPTTLAHLTRVAQRTFGDLGLVKAVVDVDASW